jgi:hypothetical protein
MVASFDGGRITTDAGALLLEQIDPPSLHLLQYSLYVGRSERC